MSDSLWKVGGLIEDDAGLRQTLQEVCDLTNMGFAAVARVTDRRWVACQVLDRIEFGLKPGDELDIKTTICDEIRASGEAVVIDSVIDDPLWRTHHTPMLYGFQSYASFPIYLDDGSFFGTLCAIDPAPHRLSGTHIAETMRSYARKVGGMLSPPLSDAAPI